jgi:hypothetical protein
MILKEGWKNLQVGVHFQKCLKMEYVTFGMYTANFACF